MKCKLCFNCVFRVSDGKVVTMLCSMCRLWLGCIAGSVASLSVNPFDGKLSFICSHFNSIYLTEELLHI